MKFLKAIMYFVIFVLIMFPFFIQDDIEKIYQESRKEPLVEEQLKTYIYDFKQECKTRNVNIKSYNKLDSIFTVDHFYDLFGYPEPTVLGRCYPFDRKIELKRVITEPKEIKLIIFHELGHCVLNKSHMTDKLGIMNPTLDITDIDKYFENWDRMLEDLYYYDDGTQGYLKTIEKNGPCYYK